MIETTEEDGERDDDAPQHEAIDIVNGQRAETL